MTRAPSVEPSSPLPGAPDDPLDSMSMRFDESHDLPCEFFGLLQIH